jgi:hypothetical protein
MQLKTEYKIYLRTILRKVIDRCEENWKNKFFLRREYRRGNL